MLGIFNNALVQPPRELNSPAELSSSVKPKLSQEILEDFVSQSGNAFSVSFGNGTSLAYVPPEKPNSIDQRFFCAVDGIYCIFLGCLNNLSSLIKQYGLSKGSDEAMFVIEAYRTLRDRGPYPVDQVLKDLDGSFGFVVFDNKTKTVFTALGANEEIRLFWGIAADGSVVLSNELEVIKASCGKSFASFPAGCMFHSKRGLMSFEHPTRGMKAMHRVDSEGAVCGANFKVDAQSRVNGVPRVGSGANWALWGSQ
ncbi:Stem-specific protein TSJT1 [Morella rubra]|uniref:Stem-specific protein TSJT1 n=1 Tax=Morella rubra TaxID=262757 RepID=A0A6A1WDD3_9ROSI|nr:Stem-specific protein TSJT1 [Morella rubra]